MDNVEGGLDRDYTAALGTLLRLDIKGNGISAARLAKALTGRMLVDTRRASLMLVGLRQMGYVEKAGEQEPQHWRLTKEARKMLLDKRQGKAR